MRGSDVEPRKVVNYFLHGRNELCLCGGSGPFCSWLERQEDVCQLGAHGVGGDLGRADATPDVLYFVRELFEEELLDARVVADGLLKGDSGQADGVEDDGPFTQPWNELASEARGCPPSPKNQHGRSGENEPAEPHCEREERAEDGIQEAADGPFFLSKVSGEEVVAEQGREGECDE